MDVSPSPTIFQTEEYAVRRHIIEELQVIFQMEPTFDLFTSPNNARFQNFFTKSDNALAQS